MWGLAHGEYPCVSEAIESFCDASPGPLTEGTEGRLLSKEAVGTHCTRLGTVGTFAWCPQASSTPPPASDHLTWACEGRARFEGDHCQPDVCLSFSFLLGHLPYFWKKDEACGRVLQDLFLDW